MPIVFVHGVTVRHHQPEHIKLWGQIEALLRQHVAPAISSDPGRVAILPAYWGDVGVQFAWGGASLPTYPPTPPDEHPLWSLLAKGNGDAFQQEWWRRAGSLPGHLTARSFEGVRHALNEQILLFLGDIVSYFHHREAIIRRVMDTLAVARRSQEARGGEPLVVLSHSMGGQIVYDIVTHDMSQMSEAEQVRIDFWAAAASQVGVFEEMKFFQASDPIHQIGNPVPRPDRRFLGTWWNVWDPNDVFSFTTRSIVADIEDTHYDSGLALHEAHSGILTLPSFYSVFAERVVSRLGRRRT